MAFVIITFISNSKLSSIFWSEICEGRSLNKLNTYCISHIYPYILLILACVLEDAHFGEGKL